MIHNGVASHAWRRTRVTAAARELRAHGAKDGKDRHLRCQQERIRQQTGLPVVHRRKERCDTRGHEKLSEDSQREETEQHPKRSRRAACFNGCFQLFHLDVEVMFLSRLGGKVCRGNDFAQSAAVTARHRFPFPFVDQSGQAIGEGLKMPHTLLGGREISLGQLHYV